jgi:diacylglycerol kinase (ATP)
MADNNNNLTRKQCAATLYSNVLLQYRYPTSGSIVAKSGNTGLRRLLNATRFSAMGIAAAWKHEAAFRLEIILLLLLVPAAIWLGQSNYERLLLVGVCLLVLLVELINSAIEATVDRISNEQHELAGRAKDMGSAAVLVSLVIVVLVWATVAWQRFGNL